MHKNALHFFSTVQFSRISKSSAKFFNFEFLVFLHIAAVGATYTKNTRNKDP